MTSPTSKNKPYKRKTIWVRPSWSAPFLEYIARKEDKLEEEWNKENYKVGF